MNEKSGSHKLKFRFHTVTLPAPTEYFLSVHTFTTLKAIILALY